MKGGGDKHGRSRLPLPLRVESRRARLLSVVAGCFLFFLVVLVSSRHDAVVFDTLSQKASSPTPATKTTTLRPSAGLGTVITEERHDAEGEAEPEEAERDSNATAATTTSISGDRASAGDAEAAVQADNSVHVTPAAVAALPAMETTSPRHGHPDSVDPQPRPPLCDFSEPRADVCDFTGDIRMDANASSFIVVVDPAAQDDGPAHKVRPYPRKGDATAMGRVTEITVRTAADAPRCTRTHTSPAVAFSASGYTGNMFHDFTDVVVPLYGAAARYRGDVQLVVADAAPWWLAKYGPLLRALSRHAPLDLARAAAAAEVHCFRHAVVGLRARREFMIEPERGLDAPSMPDFSRFLRRALSLPRDAPTQPGSGRKKNPRLLIISRRGTRRLLNVDAVVRAAEEVGFEAAVSEFDLADGVAEVGPLVNACDALVGVHGAGLTNMVFLPPGATVVQIVPWGGLRWLARAAFGDPAEAMGFRYVQYEVAAGETTLKDKYPRDHEIFTNPTALHKKGFKFMRHTLLNGQDIVVDVERFRPVLLQALNMLAP